MTLADDWLNNCKPPKVARGQGRNCKPVSSLRRPPCIGVAKNILAGELKDAGDPSRDLTPKEQAYFQSLVDNMYGQFVHDVATARHTTDEKIRPLATGQVWTGEQALSLGLIDKVGGFRVALLDTARSVGISGEPSIVRPPKSKRGLLALINGDADDLFPNPSQLLNHAPGFYFMWK